MARKVSAVVYGCGEMGLLLTRLMAERDVEIRGAIARSPAKLGRDLGELAGIGTLGVAVSGDATRVLEHVRADVAVIATTSPLSSIESQVRACLRAGSNVATLEEQSFFPWRVHPELAGEIDDLAKRSGATVLGTGLQEIYWTHLPASLMAASHNVERVVGRSTWNTDDFGSQPLDDDPIVGKPPRVLHEQEAEGTWDRPTVPPVLHALASLSNLTPVAHRASVRPVIATEDTPSARHGSVVRAGQLLGFSETVKLDTVEGPVLEFEMAGYLHAPGERSVNEWRVYGQPYIESIDHHLDARLGTCVGLVNRIPDLVNAPPGIATVASLPFPRYHHGPFTRSQ